MIDTLRVYNTLSKTKEPFETVAPGKVEIYLCGPTVYKESHIGHMVGPVIFDCIKRYLTYCGYEVTWVVNITDVDDKLIAESTRREIPMADVATEMTEDYLKNLASFGVDTIDHMPKATETMGDIIALIESLVEQGFAYESEGDVYFEVAKDSEYGKLSNRDPSKLQGDGGEGSARKRAPGDFALWKAAKADEPSWESAWGNGRPGWHIECSAMSRTLLGETFDIHGGGLDLAFPHHENEIAQSECCHGKPMARFWLHNGLMRAGTASGKVGGRGERDEPEQADVNTKISRSAGAGGLADLVERQGGERIRFFLLRTHYRSTIVFTEEAVEEAGTGLETFYRLFKRYERVTGGDFYALSAASGRAAGEFDAGDNRLLAEVHTQRTKFLTAMDDDFNTGSAVGDLFDLARALNRYIESDDLEGAGKDDAEKVAALKQGFATLRELTSTLGLFIRPVESAGGDEAVDGVVKLLIGIRDDARSNKDFALSDKIRDGVAEASVTLEDRPDGTDWTGDGDLEALMALVIEIRADARTAKNFAVADQIRDGLSPCGITIEDRAGGSEWEKTK